MKKLSLAGTIVTTVGMIIGVSIFLLLPYMAGLTGESLWLAFLIAGVPNMLAGLYLIQMAAVAPVSGAHFLCISRWVSPRIGTLTSFSLLICLVSVACMLSLGLGNLVALLVPAANAKAVAVAALILFSVLNLLGLRFFEALQTFMFVLLVLGVVTFAIFGLNQADESLRSPFMPMGAGNFLMAITIASNAWMGILGITEYAGMIERPRRNIPIGVLASLMIVGILYFLMAYTFTGLVGWQEAGKIGPTGVFEVAQARFPSWAAWLVVAAGLLHITATINALVLLAANIMNPLAAAGVLPKIFQRTDPNTGMPIFSIIVYTVISCALLVLFGGKLENYALVSVQAIMISQIFGATSMLRMPSRAPELFSQSAFQFRTSIRWIIWLACIVGFLAIIGFGLYSDFWVSLSYFIVFGVSFAYWEWRQWALRREGIDLQQQVSDWVSKAI